MTETDKLRRWFRKAVANGLTNFHVDVVPGATVEEVCREVNEAIRQVESGEAETIYSFGDSNRPQVDTKELFAS